MENATFNSTAAWEAYKSTFNSTDYNSTYNSTWGDWRNGTSDPFTAPKKPFWTNLLLPVLYIGILVGSLLTFSSTYRKRQLSKQAQLENWFPPHKQRNIYLSLLHMDPKDSSGEGEKSLTKVPDSVLKAALLRRAVEDIERIVKLRAAKPALQNLLQRGSVGDELWQRFLREEKEMEEEVKDVVSEANAFAPGWGQVIFQSANEINQNRLIKERTAEIQAKLEGEKSWWEQKRAGAKSELLSELGLEDDARPIEVAEALPTKGSSDDDAVLVEADAEGPSGSNAQQGNAKKRKGKK